MVSYDGLDTRLVMHVHDEFFAAFGSHRIRPGLMSILASKEILHTNMMYSLIISRMSNECYVLSNVVRGRLTHSSCFTRSALLLNTLGARSAASGGGVVVKRVGRPRHSGVLNQAREVLLAQKTEDANNLACVTTSTRHNRPVPAQVIKKNY